jgi:RNA polymerase sigma factor (sigma-70 family)
MAPGVSVLAEKVVARLFASAKAERWLLTPAQFRETLEASLERAFEGRTPSLRDIDRYLSSLHLDDLALACGCAAGNDAAWEHIIREYRPLLYRSADALDASGGAREIADALYGELYERALFRYFHGRSSLSTWLRSVLAQRYVDRVRAVRRLEPLPDEDSPMQAAAPAAPEPDVARYQAAIEHALLQTIASLPPRDRLRLGCYYAQRLTLAETGRVLREHEATVSRQLARTRRDLRKDIERVLLENGLTKEEIARCFDVAVEDAGALDLDRMFAEVLGRKISDPERSQ